jgi:hypothetical protein
VVEEVLEFELPQELVLHHVLLYEFFWDLFQGVEGVRF